MYDVIVWLIGVETTATKIYDDAAAFFHEDKEFSRLLSQMSFEEKEHEKLLQKISSLLSDDEMKRASFFFDESFRSKIEAPFSRALGLFEDGALDKTTMLEMLVDAEFSEWNEILLYILDRLNVSDREVQQVMADIELHRGHVEAYISSLPNRDDYFKRIRKRSQEKGKRILIVENNLSVARMLKVLVIDDAEVIIARNGQEGLLNLRQKHFDLVVSDVEMPIMSGIEMFRQALEIDPSLSRKFIFFTGTVRKEYLDLIKTLNVVMLPKPSPVKFISLKMNEVLKLASPPHDSTIH